MKSINWLMALLLVLAVAFAAACAAEGKANDDDDDGGIPQADDDDDSGDDDAADDDDSGDDDDDEMECWEVWAMCEYEHPFDDVPDECGDAINTDDPWAPYREYMTCAESAFADRFTKVADCGESNGCSGDWKSESYRCYQAYHTELSVCYQASATQSEFADCRPTYGPTYGVDGDYYCSDL